ncbi:MAG TPA: hypothetical protein VJ204_18675, partial [Solirubrobacterales bacterium]|nr:hypothetical protein [Solirubrobacterales bacterium]
MASLSMLALIVGAAMWLGPGAAQGDEASGDVGPAAPLPAGTMELIEAGILGQAGEGAETDLHAAQTMPHRDLDAGEALALAEGVFGAALESPAGIYGELEAEKFVSDNAAIVPASTLSKPAEGDTGEGPTYEPHGGIGPNQPVLIESTLPLRTENADGEREAVDLELEHSEGELQPANPLVEVGIPQELGEGISLGGPEIELTVAGAPVGAPATDAEGQFAFYPEVAEDTDLIVAPTAQGVETLTDIRSADAPTRTTYDLALPEDAELIARQGGAEVLEGGKTALLIPPPTAIDAAGNPVETELSVQGDSIAVKTTVDPSTAYPVLVDPNFLYEKSNWAYEHAGFAGWTSGTSNPSATLPVPYWIWNSAMPGIDLSWGFGGNAHNGDTSSWSYTVPRFSEDISRFSKAPSTWIYVWLAEDIFFSKTNNNAAWPALIWGITSSAGWVNDQVHSGAEEEWNTEYDVKEIVNESSNGAAKSALMALLTGEEEDPAKRRDAYIGNSTMVLVDEDAPIVKELTPPTKWLNTTAEPINFAVEDAGLGVENSWASVEGTSESGWGFQLPCVGTNASPCPRIARSGTAGKDETQVALHYDPTALSTGKHLVNFEFGDAVFGPSGGAANHAGGGLVTLKIDHTAPEVTLSGALTEQEKLGTLKSEYPLSIKATDGTEADPQSGVAKVEVKVDGKLKQTWSPGCATENCS